MIFVEIVIQLSSLNYFFAFLSFLFCPLLVFILASIMVSSMTLLCLMQGSSFTNPALKGGERKAQRNGFTQELLQARTWEPIWKKTELLYFHKFPSYCMSRIHILYTAILFLCLCEHFSCSLVPFNVMFQMHSLANLSGPTLKFLLQPELSVLSLYRKLKTCQGNG